MSPVRHEDDYQRKPIKDWDSYIEDAITDAQKRGEFDNLPGAGKPIKIQTNPHNPELDFAFSRLKNAGYKPTWMELDEEIKSGQHQLQSFLDASVVFVEQTLETLQSPDFEPSVEVTQSVPFWRRLLFGSRTEAPSNVGPQSLEDIGSIVERMRSQYLERSAQLDKRIGEFNSALSRDLWHLERMRISPERASAKFDAAFSSVVGSMPVYR